MTKLSILANLMTKEEYFGNTTFSFVYQNFIASLSSNLTVGNEKSHGMKDPMKGKNPMKGKILLNEKSHELKIQ